MSAVCYDIHCMMMGLKVPLAPAYDANASDSEWTIMNRQNADSQVSLLPYVRQIPQIFLYQLISRGILLLIMFLYHRLTGFILWNIGRPAYTSGDLPYLMTTWEGWVLLACGFLVLVIYTVFDVNAAILMSEKLLKDERVHALPLLCDAAKSMNRFRSMRGFWAIMYVSLAAPLTGAAFGITLTSNFVIPNFIVSVIRRQGILHLLYAAGLIALGIVGFVYVFTFDFAILGGQPVSQAMRSSKAVQKLHWKHFLVRYILFSLKWLALLAGIVVILYILPCGLMRLLPLGSRTHHAGIIFFSLLTGAAITLYLMLVIYYTQMKLTLLYHAYTCLSHCLYLIFTEIILACPPCTAENRE